MRQLAIVLGVLAVTAGCSKDKPAEQPLTPASGTIDTVEGASDSIAGARCDREQRCGQIGATAKYNNREHCMSVMRAESKEMIGKCPQGVDQSDVQDCVTEIANQDCSNLIDDLEQSIACGADDLCQD